MDFERQKPVTEEYRKNFECVFGDKSTFSWKWGTRQPKPGTENKRVPFRPMPGDESERNGN